MYGGLGSIAAGSSDTLSNSIGVHSLSVGTDTEASGNYSTALGLYTKASGTYSCATGNQTTASGESSHAEGSQTTASGRGSHAEGGHYNSTNTISSWTPETGVTIDAPLASGDNSHAEGNETYAKNYNSHAEGFRTMASGTSSHAEGDNTEASGASSHAEGSAAIASGLQSHAEGSNAIASGINSHAEGYGTYALGISSHAEGGDHKGNGTHRDPFSVVSEETQTSISIIGSRAEGNDSHAEGVQTYAEGYVSHTEGIQTHASGICSHAEGFQTFTKYSSSHAEGMYTQAINTAAHAEGSRTIASGMCSHAGGYQTIASNDYNTVIGRYNTDDRDAPLQIGAGSLAGARWTSFWVNWEGNLNVSHYKVPEVNGDPYTLDPAGNSWIDATHNWTATTESALNIWNRPSDGGFHSWIRHRTANNHFVMGVIPSNNGFYIAANPAGANTSTNSIAKMLNWNGSNGNLSISGSLSQGSDRRLKNIYGNTTEEETLAILENVNIVNFSYKYDNDIENNVRSGIIAQDLQQILEEHNIENRAYLTTIDVPRNEALTESIENEEEEPWSEDEMTKEFLGINYIDLVPILIKGWQIHEQEIKELKARIQELEEK